MFGFNTQPPEGGWERPERAASRESCFNTQPPEGGWPSTRTTHSRQNGFNTQPPEGGWHQIVICRLKSAWFQHTAARRRLGRNLFVSKLARLVSTHSRPKAAGTRTGRSTTTRRSFNTQPPEGGWNRAYRDCFGQTVSTHSRPKAAGAF